jgi:SNF2 family DNA or RNA helicase
VHFRGLGKSLQALTALAVLRIEKQLLNKPFLVICPASVVLHWGDEVARYFPARLLSAVKFASVPNSFDPSVAGGATVVVVSYEMLRRDVNRGAKSVLRGCVWEAVVLDEAHLIKNPAAGTTKAVCSLQSLHRIALSGTPVQNQVRHCCAYGLIRSCFLHAERKYCCLL